MIEMIEKMLDEKIFLLFLPESASRFLQPLDSAPFGAFKRRMREAHEGIEPGVAFPRDRLFKALPRACHEADQPSMTERSIKKASESAEYSISARIS